MADISNLQGQALRDAKWVLSFTAGEQFLAGCFRPNRERELLAAGVLIPTDEEGVFAVGKLDA